MIRRSFGLALVLALSLPALAATTTEDGGAGAGEVSALSEQKRAGEAELQSLRRRAEISESRQAELREEIAKIEQDGARLNGELIAAGKRLRATEEEITAIEGRLAALEGNAAAIRGSLRDRRNEMAELLMALQRMGRTPPPAILSRPQDALAAIRGSILAGAVLPDLSAQAKSLAADLVELTSLTARIEAELEAMRASEVALQEDQFRIRLLIDSKRVESEQTQAALAAEEERASALAAEADTVETLISSLEGQITAAAAAAREAEQASREAAQASESEAARRLADTSRMAPAVPFERTRGLLTLPAAGETVVNFGDADENGGEHAGIYLETRPGATVTAPADGWVMYAGPFRTYGQVLILNVGDGYHIVMAGMERIDATLGQFVLAGEPVAEMGQMQVASAGDFKHTSARRRLYVEFRKDGAAIDSAPWWTDESNGEVNG
jgi:septal ring factor EnvC (AmiA/AmiB activator)